MELVVRKSDLLKELSLLQGIVERKNTIPILANVLLEASKGSVSLLATDLDVGLRSRCEAQVAKPGTLTLPEPLLYTTVKGEAPPVIVTFILAVNDGRSGTWLRSDNVRR